MAIKDDTKRIVVTVELEIDEDGVDNLVDAYKEDMNAYLNDALDDDITVAKVLKIEEFGE
ncbi:MAG: hypothetical protein AB7D29_07635 [Campylobacterales bacterium]